MSSDWLKHIGLGHRNTGYKDTRSSIREEIMNIEQEILSKLAQRALMSDRPVNDRILSARFKTATLRGRDDLPGICTNSEGGG